MLAASEHNFVHHFCWNIEQYRNTYCVQQVPILDNRIYLSYEAANTSVIKVTSKVIDALPFLLFMHIQTFFPFPRMLTRYQTPMSDINLTSSEWCHATKKQV